MYAVEAAFLLITAAWLVVTNTTRATRGTSFKLFLAGLGVAVVAFALDQARIHMVPAAVVFIVLSLFLLRRGYSHVAVRSVGVAARIDLRRRQRAARARATRRDPAGARRTARGRRHVFHARRRLEGRRVVRRARKADERFTSRFGIPARCRRKRSAPRPRGLWQELYRPPGLDVIFGVPGRDRRRTPTPTYRCRRAGSPTLRSCSARRWAASPSRTRC